MKQVIVITGASSGFGALTARALARAGYIVYAGMRETTGRNAPQVAEVARYADEHTVDLRSVELDVASDQSANAGIAKVIADTGRLDVVIHNAGHMSLPPATAFTPEQFAQLYDINVLSTQRVNRAALPQLRKQGRGLVVWVSSSSARGGTPPYLSPYFAAKAAMDSLAVSYAGELARWGIETSIIVPGAFTKGTNHFAHSGSPADKAGVGQYDDGPYAGLPDQALKGLASLGARPDRRCDGHCCRLASSGSVCEGEQLQEVVGGADHGPFGAHFLYAPQQELAEAASLFDLSEHRFHHLLSQSVGCFEAAVVDLLSHPLGQRSADFSVRCCRVLGASGRDIAVNAVCFERFEIGFAAVAGVRRGLIRLAAEIVLDGLDQGHQLALIVAALRQFVRDNDLGACVDGGLGIVGLNEAILRLHDAAFRIGEVALRLGIRLVRWRRRRFARLLAAFGLALLFLFGLDATLFRRRQPGVGLQRRHRLLDLRQSFLLVAGPIRHLVAALVLAESLVLFRIRRLGGRQHASDLGFQFRLAFLHALITHRFMFRRVRFDLRAIKRDMAEFDQPCRLAQLQNLHEQRAERLQMPLAEVADRAKIRRIERHNHHKIVPFAAGLRDPTRRIQPTRIAVQQKRHHHPRVKRRLPKTTHIAARDLLEIRALPHQLNDKPRDMALSARSPAHSAAEAASHRYSRGENTCS